MDYFKGKYFQKDMIFITVGYYLRYNLSYREVQEYSKVLYLLWNKKNRQFFYLWNIDYIPISKLKATGIISIVHLMLMA
jgi:Transposase and inactivated derivatives